MNKTRESPRYYGMFKHVDREAGYALWFPKGWHRFDMIKGHQGVIYSPYPNDLDTVFLAEKRMLEYSVAKKDLPILYEGFREGLVALDGIEIESQNKTVTSTLITLEARFTYCEEGTRRKRWVRNIYWGNGQLVLVAQGTSPEEFEYWLPMFYNIMTTFETG